MKSAKICCIASSGGHWEELNALNQVVEEREHYYITEEGTQAQDYKFSNIYFIPKTARKDKHFIIKFLKLWSIAIKITISERPDIILTTGALIAIPFCFVGKLFGSKIIYIESFARVNNKSLSGRILYPIADLFIVQWKSMMKYYPKAIYGGKIF